MIKTFKCDHCNYTSEDPIKVILHEKTCIFNESNKACATCENEGDEGSSRFGSMPVCNIGLNLSVYRYGGCKFHKVK
jgi:hypothetical protein